MRRRCGMKARSAISILDASLLALLGGCASIGAGPLVPDALKVPESQTLSPRTHATGVQIYECKADQDDPTKFEWSLKGPEADLFDHSGRKIGKHYAGPTWESNDGSKVVGEVKARDDGPSASAIPWLLLSAKSTSGSGAFSRTQAIQRLYTVGGKAPPAACSKGQLGNRARGR